MCFAVDGSHDANALYSACSRATISWLMVFILSGEMRELYQINLIDLILQELVFTNNG